MSRNIYKTGKCDYCGEKNKIIRPTPFMADIPAMMCKYCWDMTEEEYGASNGEYIGKFEDGPGYEEETQKNIKHKKIYIASSWKNAHEVRAIASKLREIGFQVDDFTDDSKGRYVFHYSEIGQVQELDAIKFLEDKRSQKAFREDKKWIDWADYLLLYLPAGKSSHLEAGYAKGRGKKLIIYQHTYPKGEFDVMYGFADLITDNFQQIVLFLKGF